MNVSHRIILLLACCCIASGGGATRGDDESSTERNVASTIWIDDFDVEPWNNIASDSDAIQQTSLLQPAPLILPTPQIQPATPLPPAATELRYSLFGLGGLEQSILRQSRLGIRPVASDLILGSEASARVTTDVGSLLRKSPKSMGVNVQRRTPIVNDPRMRGSRVGALGASGSYWIPARIDLDSMVSKIDSRIVNETVVIPGPYSALYGPGFQFFDIELSRSPRYSASAEVHGLSGIDYNTNGDQWNAIQKIWGGTETWGLSVSYVDRTGSDYLSGDRTRFASGYNSREFDIAFGIDRSPDESLEFNYLRLDQTDVEFPGYAFDIDFLVTDGFDINYQIENGTWFDQIVVDTWYNRTRFEGNAQNPSKRIQFPFLDLIRYVGTTDVDSMSTGCSARANWGDATDSLLTSGIDFRFVKQELNEIASGVGLGLPIPFFELNSPIPRSFIANPGMFVEQSQKAGKLELTVGGRVDFAIADIVDSPSKLAQVGLGIPQASYAELVGTDETQADFALWSLYGSAAFEVNCNLVVTGNIGYAERPPNLTELYAAQPFMFLLQNGLNTVTGDPTLEHERLFQIDIGASYRIDACHAGVRGFYAQAREYVTFEALSTRPAAAVEQINLKYVNTDQAILAGGEAYAEYDAYHWLTPFATIKYVSGRDMTRNGEFATTEGAAGSPSMQVAGLPRGFFSGISGSAEEPLPGIPPLESRIGLTIHDGSESRGWEVEISARIVDAQTRVATSLLELPTPGFTVFDLRGFWRPSGGCRMFAGIENITDRNYREHFDLQSQTGTFVFQPGVNFYFGTEISY